MLRRRQKSNDKEDNFMYFVQLHERAWGMESYSGRPQLEDIMNAGVVVFWKVEGNEDRYMVTVHQSLDEVEHYFSRLLFRSSVNLPRKRVIRIFHQQKRLIVKGVKIDFGEIDA